MLTNGIETEIDQLLRYGSGVGGTMVKQEGTPIYSFFFLSILLLIDTMSGKYLVVEDYFSEVENVSE